MSDPASSARQHQSVDQRIDHNLPAPIVAPRARRQRPRPEDKTSFSRPEASRAALMSSIAFSGAASWQPHTITEGVRHAFDDAAYWVQHDTHSVQEAAVRLHHRLVLVHPWRNGNGRHARLVADVLVAARGADELTWGARTDLNEPGGMRQRYIAALQAADAGDFRALLEFARS